MKEFSRKEILGNIFLFSVFKTNERKIFRRIFFVCEKSLDFQILCFYDTNFGPKTRPNILK